jgi:ATP-binding cassette subfamily B protein
MEKTVQNHANAWGERLSALKNLPPVLAIIWKSGRGVCVATLAVRCMAALLPLAALAIGRSIINIVVETAKHPGPIPTAIWWLLAGEFLIAGIGTFLGRCLEYTDARLADEFAREVSLRIMRHAASLDLQSFEDPVFYDKLERARFQATGRIGMLNSLGNLLQQTVTLVSLSLGVIYYSPLLFLVLLVCVLPAFVAQSHFAFVGYSLEHSLTPLRRELDYLRDLATSKEAAKELKVFGLGGYLRNRFRGITDQVISRTRSLLKRRVIAGSALGVLSSGGYYASYAYIVIRTLQGQMSVGDLTFLAGALQGTSSQIQLLFSSFTSIADQALFLTDLVSFFAIKPKIGTVVGRPALPAPRKIAEGFEFQKVSFHYAGQERMILKNLDFRIEPGERVALVGENGQGKTTLVKLISRLYDPTGGRILLDGIDLREYDLETLQREIGVIFQDFVRYEMTARENIGVGRIEYMDDENMIREAARQSKAAELFDRLPNGIDQLLGRRFEGGVDLSGGEWQKFALARAYARDAQLLILDEPTAALDAPSEYEIFCRFAELTQGKMALLISHRFSTVRMCDRIVVLEGGVIREEGTHDQLVESGGKYADMFELQAASYR